MIKTKDEFIKKCKEDKNVVFEDKFEIKIGRKTYNVNAFGTKMSDKCIRAFINRIESLIE